MADQECPVLLPMMLNAHLSHDPEIVPSIPVHGCRLRRLHDDLDFSEVS
jgi:hypothetical protein